MKNKKILLAVLAVALVLGMTACDNGGPSSPSGGGGSAAQSVTYGSIAADGDAYTLVITEEKNTGRAAYNAKGGDAYVLTYFPKAGGAKKTTSGKVASVTDGTITLGSSATITITITGQGMEKISGTVTWDNESTSVTVTVTLTPAVDKDFLISNGVLIRYIGAGGKVTIPSSVTSIGDNAFYNCSRLTSVTIPDSVTSIGAGAFTGCNLTSVTIPNSVTSIGGSAFANSGITSVTIPDSVTSIGYLAINSSRLTTITVVPANTVYSSQDGVLYNKDKTTLIEYPAAKKDASFTIPNSVTSIEDFAISDSRLPSIIIPDSVISIGQAAFLGCTLTSATIGSGVTSIGNESFAECINLTSVTFKSTITSSNFGSTRPFYGDLRDKYLAAGGGPGTYITEKFVWVWTKQP